MVSPDHEQARVFALGTRIGLKGNSRKAGDFTEPILQAWGLDYLVLSGSEPLGQLQEYYAACRRDNRPGIALLPEGR